MSFERLSVLVVDDHGPIAAAAARALGLRGHDVRTAASRAEALAAPDGHVLVIGTELVDGSGLELLKAMRARGSRARAVLVGRLTRPDEMRSALRLGVCELLARPCEVEELVQAVELGPRPALAATPSPEAPSRRLRASLLSEPDEIEDTLRRLSAFLLREAVSPSTRMRATTACAEVLDNVRLHAYADDMQGVLGRAELMAEISAGELVVRVVDQGDGFDTQVARRAVLADTHDSGLARAAALSEDLQVESMAELGTCVTLRFVAYRSGFEEDELLDLSELDWMPPSLSHRVLADLRDGGEPRCSLSPAQAVTIGRLLAGGTDRSRADCAQWS